MKKMMVMMLLFFLVARINAQEITLDNLMIGRIVVGQIDSVQSLIRAGADVNKRFDMGASRNITPLYLAVSLGYVELGKILIDSGANVNSEFEGLNLLHIAAIYAGNRPIIELLLSLGLDVNSKSTGAGDFENVTPLHLAAGKGTIEVVETLIKNGADVNVKDSYYGFTPLHLAARNGHKEIAKLLMANGAELNSKAQNGKTPLELAADNEYMELVDLFQKYSGISEELQKK